MDINMNMSSHETESGLTETEYDDEVMCAGWIPDVALMCQLQPFESTNKLTNNSSDLATVNADLFMQRVFAYQR
jgi:hypothetical protein